MSSLLVVTPNLSDNSTGRAWVWWLLAKELGWRVTVVSASGASVWEPLRDTEFARDCVRLESQSSRGRVNELLGLARKHRVTVAVKPLPASLGLVLRARAVNSFPLVIDVDDPDLDARLHRGSLLKRFAWRLRFFDFWIRVRRFERLNRTAAVAVSNPELQALYGGRVLPHVRPDPGGSRPHTPGKTRVAFIGTVREHKGVDRLRAAVAEIQQHGVELLVTAPSPSDPRPWELWVGEGSISEGREHLYWSDIVALPSTRDSFSEGQLPAKLIDAMMSGRVVVVSAIAPMPWAVGTPELTFPPDSHRDLVNVLLRLVDPTLRQRLGLQLRERAIAEFSVKAGLPVFLGLIQEAEYRLDGRENHLKKAEIEGE